MKAYKCDRCGKFYELTYDQNRKRIRDNKFQVCDSTHCLDFCDECLDDLQEWMPVHKEAESEE